MTSHQVLTRAARIPAVVAALGAALSALPAPPAAAQYFGRNKVQYENFKFQVLKTEHFDIYFYPAEREAVEDASRMAERWYARLGTTLNHTFTERKPIILYANQADFQQTNVVEGLIGEGTGGVTESLKDRVVLPLTGIYRESDHVLGHELVHAFQYDIARSPGDTVRVTVGQIPLWLIEGMAEYLSLGRRHPLTAMWLRDAVLNNDFPTIRQLSTDPGYFPYRFGHALWAYIGGRWGDDRVGRIFRLAGQYGLDVAIRRVLNLSPDELSKAWKDDTIAACAPSIAGRTPPSGIGRRLLGKGEPRDLNVAPAVSPDGRKIAFFSQKDVFSIDLYIADTGDGRNIRKLVTSRRNPHFDALRFIDSAGSWSPDGRKFAFVVFADGDNHLEIADVGSGRIERKIRAPEVDAIANPAWSPDGRSIAFSGSTGGLSDLYVVDLATGRVSQITNDRYADLQPAWSPDGSTLAFVTDRRGTDLDALSYGRLRIGLVPAQGGEIRVLSLFEEADHRNPQFSPDGRELCFIADPDGIPDVYRASLQGGSIERLTHVATGVSGITDLSPALSVGADGRLFVSIFQHRGYSIHALEPETASPVAAGMAAGTAAGPANAAGGGNLPPLATFADTSDVVDRYLADTATGLPARTTVPTLARYSPSLSLDYLGAAASGVVIDRFGTSLGGAIGLSFSDMLGNRNIDAAVQANGGIKDVGGQAVYQNRAHRWNWGIGGGHVPYLSVFTVLDTGSVVIDGQPHRADVLEQRKDRVFVDRAMLIATYPFSTTRRLEFTGGYTHYGFDTEVERLFIVDGVDVGSTVEGAPSPPGIDFFQGAAAIVGDDSFFGFTSPVRGGRYRFEVEPTFGSLSLVNVLADYRRYVFLNPVTVAVRGFHYGRYGRDAEDDRLSPLFLGYGTFVRGYSDGSFDLRECTSVTGADCPEFNRLVGSRIGVANLEVRLPLFGTRDFGLIDFPFLPTELSGFVDGGVAWSNGESPKIEFVRRTSERVPVFSTGLSARVNLFGALVGEIYYAYPFQRPDKGGHFGFQISPGW